METDANAENKDTENQPLEKDVNSEKKDFFANLQQNESQKGADARGKGHGWTTLIETLLGDW